MHASVLKYFVEVARCGSVRKASENLYVAASAVNRQILKLEDELGGELFDRMPNGMRLNAAGERLLRHVQSTLHDFQVMRSELDALKGERTGHVKLASMDSFFVDFLPAAIEEFSQVYPAVTYTIASYGPMEVVPQLQSGRFDVGMTFVGRLPAGIEAVGLGSAADRRGDGGRSSARGEGRGQPGRLREAAVPALARAAADRQLDVARVRPVLGRNRAGRDSATGRRWSSA